MQYDKSFPGRDLKGVGVGPGRWYLSRVFRLTVEAFAVIDQAEKKNDKG